MRKSLPILLLLTLSACSLPKRHNPELTVKPKIPYPLDVPAPEALSEGSLWRDRSVVSDMRARYLNDLVTVRIVESTSALSKADVNTSRDGSNSLAAPSLFARFGSEALGSGSTSAKTTATKNAYKGAGTTGRSAVVNTTITARVVKVLGNGNVIFEGYRDIQINNEHQRLYVAGLLDPMRLDAANSIASSQVAELHIGYGGVGVVDETLKPGFISRLLSYVWPF